MMQGQTLGNAGAELRAVAIATAGAVPIVVVDDSEGMGAWKLIDGLPVALPSPAGKPVMAGRNVRLATGGSTTFVAWVDQDAEQLMRLNVSALPLEATAWKPLPELGWVDRADKMSELAASASGTVAVVFRTSDLGCHVRTLPLGATAWTSTTAPPEAREACKFGGQVAITADGKVWLAWHEQATGIRLAAWDGTAWHLADPKLALGVGVSVRDLLVAADGTLYVSWIADRKAHVGTFTPS